MTSARTTTPRVLLVGFDPRTVPGVDAAMVETAIAMGEDRLRAAHLDFAYCFVAPEDSSADERIVDALRAASCDCVVIGNGIRAPAEFLLLFERIVNLVREHAPGAAIAFNSNPLDSADAALRWIHPDG
jgi:hypothetical protein